MATRRQIGLDGDRENLDYGSDFFGGQDDILGMFGNPPAPAGSNQAPQSDDDLFGLELGAGLTPPPGVTQADPSAGSTDRYRELTPNQAPTHAPISIPMGATTDAMYEEPSMDVGPLPREPAPSIMDGGAPLSVGEGYGTQRPPLQSSGAASALFGEDDGGGGLFGGAGGLNEGGYGLPGSGGPPAPTAMMQALLRALKLG